jgi:RimJ/RimL family protein N-acetyltransferase
MAFAFRELGQERVLAYTAATNTRSRRLMERLGMRYDPDADFAHPKVAPRHRIQPHVVYRISVSDWASREPG